LFGEYRFGVGSKIMKGKYTKTKFKCKKGCGCKLCKPHKGGHEDFRMVKDRRESEKHEQELEESDE
jgi:hypothetical protein